MHRKSHLVHKPFATMTAGNTLFLVFLLMLLHVFATVRVETAPGTVVRVVRSLVAEQRLIRREPPVTGATVATTRLIRRHFLDMDSHVLTLAFQSLEAGRAVKAHELHGPMHAFNVNFQLASSLPIKVTLGAAESVCVYVASTATGRAWGRTWTTQTGRGAWALMIIPLQSGR